MRSIDPHAHGLAIAEAGPGTRVREVTRGLLGLGGGHHADDPLLRAHHPAHRSGERDAHGAARGRDVDGPGGGVLGSERVDLGVELLLRAGVGEEKGVARGIHQRGTADVHPLEPVHRIFGEGAHRPADGHGQEHGPHLLAGGMTAHDLGVEREVHVPRERLRDLLGVDVLGGIGVRGGDGRRRGLGGFGRRFGAAGGEHQQEERALHGASLRRRRTSILA
jgi:hypothetical protein